MGDIKKFCCTPVRHDDGETLQSFASRITRMAREAEHRDAMVAAVPGVSWRAPAGPGSGGLCLPVTQVSYTMRWRLRRGRVDGC